MRIIVCGYGEVGINVVKRLETAGVDFIVIDKDKKAFEARPLGVGREMVGDATKESVLNEAEIYNATALIAATGSDSTNAFITLIANALNPDIVVLARVRSIESVERLYKAGADYVVDEIKTSARAFIRYALEPYVADLADKISLAKDVDIIDMKIPPSSPLCNQTIKDSGIKDRFDVVVIVVRRGKRRFKIPSPNFRLRAGDTLVILGQADNINAFQKYAMGKS